jgi:hypothetical protein
MEERLGPANERGAASSSEHASEGPQDALPGAGSQQTPSAEAGVIYPITLQFGSLRADSLTVVKLFEGTGPTQWSLGSIGAARNGLSIANPMAMTMNLKMMAVTARQITLLPGGNNEILWMQIFLQTHGEWASGTASLPEGVTLSIITLYDRTNIFGNGSWAIHIPLRSATR